jgi:photosystem II stability/assembly factor-like uncharacterized protein
MAISLCLCLPARAIDPARLHMKPFGHSPQLNTVPGPLRPKTLSRAERSVIPILQPEAFAARQWIALGPDPIPNGQTYTSHGTAPPSKEVPVSGRVSAIAVDPKHPKTVYVGGAQGGVYRSFDGGQTWEQLIKGTNALNFAIGSITVDPTDSSRVLIGTGEGNLSADSYFGVGVYLVTGATSENPVLNGPFNVTSANQNAFMNRSIVKILVDPQNNSIVFCATSSGVGGLGAQTGATLPNRGLYRSTNFASLSPTFDQLTVGVGTNVICTSAAMDPTNPDHVVCSLFGQVADSKGHNLQGGLYYSMNATSATPTFTLATVTKGPVVSKNLAILINVKLDISPDGQTVLAATDEYDTNQQDQGLLRKSTDGGQTYPTILTAADGFAGGQGFYNVAIAIDQTKPQNVYLAGTLSSTGVDPDGPPGHGYMYIDGQVIANPGPPNPQATGHGPINGGGIFQYSTDGGATFTPSVNGLHADSHAIAISKSNPKVLYTGNDGGVWTTSDVTRKWEDINTKGFSATQFESIAVHPTNKNFSIGGTQDNGTIFFKPDGSIVRADFGDGGYALIDQSAKNTEQVTMYHTYFNVTDDLIGFSRVLKTSCAEEGEWSFLGIYTGDVDPTVHCDGTTDRFNGIQLTDSVNFYAPIALGPGTPNIVYFGSDTLYRSDDRGNTMFPASATPIEAGVPVSAIGISPTNDNIRVVGLNNGDVYATVTGGALVNLNVGLPVYVTRIVMDPVNPDVVYICYNGYLLTGPNNVLTVVELTNLSAAVANPANANFLTIGPPTSFATSVNGFVVDPLNTQNLFASTDQGVYASTDGGNTWALYGTGLPDVEVFDLKLQSPGRVLRAATHGLGVFEISVPTP